MMKKKICIYADGKGTIEMGPMHHLIKEKGCDLLIKPLYVGVCGTDKKIINLEYEGVCYPRIIGHEWVGEILYSENSNFKVADIITGECSFYCNECSYCKNDVNTCEKLQKFGITKDGAMRSEFWFPSQYAHSLSDVDYLWCFVEPLASILHLLDKISINSDRAYDVFVVGMGQMGILSVIALGILFDNINISIFDTSKHKEKKAKKMLNITNIIKNKYEIVIDSVGNEESIKYCLSKVKRGGQLCLMGTSSGKIEVPNITLNCISVYGTIGGSNYFKKAIDIVKQRKDILKKIEKKQFLYNVKLQI